ncbi:capsule biosynthesis GfcC family protein [Salinicola avicenniae]|uniref:capsule biosynthesis GfcC family protein n=1 Tax=Salinicola avicenniae TaxID=2916836 RepID=UPI002072AE94|nr:MULTISPECIES: capsule biosynthesis GfcC family protein [unclassified Salinicola]
MVTPIGTHRSTGHGWLPGLLAGVLTLVGSVALAQDDVEPATTFTIDIEGTPVPESPTLLDAWSRIEAHTTVNWMRAFVVRQDLQAENEQEKRRLQAELEGLSLQARVLDAPGVAEGLSAWREALDRLDKGRVPGRVDPTWLMANLRDVPQVTDIDRIGWCATPDWVEAWTPLGIERLPWLPEMTTDDLLAALPSAATERADTLQVISPQGEVREIGIAAWNHEQAPLIPGSRLIVAVPLDSVGARWVDDALPHFLASRLPGDDCTLVDTDSLYH